VKLVWGQGEKVEEEVELKEEEDHEDQRE